MSSIDKSFVFLRILRFGWFPKPGTHLVINYQFYVRKCKRLTETHTTMIKNYQPVPKGGVHFNLLFFTQISS